MSVCVCMHKSVIESPCFTEEDILFGDTTKGAQSKADTPEFKAITIFHVFICKQVDFLQCICMLI